MEIKIVNPSSDEIKWIVAALRLIALCVWGRCGFRVIGISTHRLCRYWFRVIRVFETLESERLHPEI